MAKKCSQPSLVNWCFRLLLCGREGVSEIYYRQLSLHTLCSCVMRSNTTDKTVTGTHARLTTFKMLLWQQRRYGLGQKFPFSLFSIISHNLFHNAWGFLHFYVLSWRCPVFWTRMNRVVLLVGTVDSRHIISSSRTIIDHNSNATQLVDEK